MLEHIIFKCVVGGIGSFEAGFFRRHSAEGLHVGIYFEVKAAFQFGALAGKFLRVERYILETGGRCTYRDKVGHPAGAAQRASAGADTAYAAGFLTRSNLLHLYPHLESLGKDLDKMTEIYAFVGDIIEDCLVAVALVFHVAYLHVEFEILGYLAGADHRIVLLGFGFFEATEIGRFCLAEHTAQFGVGLHTGLADLKLYKASGEGHFANVVTRSGFHGHNVAY